jgi:uncharacterized membrane protein YkvA (DUF1232 family)
VWTAAAISLSAIVIMWLALVTVLIVARPDTGTLRDLPRMLPDTIRLVGRLARDPEIPRSARWPVWFLAAYLALPIDLIPDFIPVIGFVDDAIITALVLRRLCRKAGTARLVHHWPGSAEGLVTLTHLLRLDQT